MTEEMTALARRAVACKGWRWMPGMRTLPTPTVPSLRHAGSEFPYLQAREGSLPDLRDPATLGCLLALVREAWDGELLCVAFDYDSGEWAVRLWNGSALTYGKGATEAEALVATLVAA